MKKIITISCLVILANLGFGQLLHTVPYFDWSSKTAFELSPPPLIKGYGYYSDSLSKAHDGVQFYEYNQVYYPIETWADYYYWFTDAYWFMFEVPQLYDYYYLTDNDLEMARFVACNYTGRYYPTRLRIDLMGNRQGYNRTRKGMSLPVNDKRETRMVNQLARKTARFKTNDVREKPFAADPWQYTSRSESTKYKASSTAYGTKSYSGKSMNSGVSTYKSGSTQFKGASGSGTKSYQKTRSAKLNKGSK